MQAVRLAKLAVSLSFALLCGCATPQLADPELTEYRRVDAQLRAIDELEAFQRACRARGGVVYTNGNRGRLRPRLPDLSTTRCMAPFTGRPR